MAFWKDLMINWLSNLINHNRSAAKISQVLCSNQDSTIGTDFEPKMPHLWDQGSTIGPSLTPKSPFFYATPI